MTVSGNAAGNRGSGVYNFGTLTLTNVTVTGNSSGNQGSGIWYQAGTSTPTNVPVSGNSANNDVADGVVTPAFSALTSPAIVYGTPSVTLTGHIGNGTNDPLLSSVAITLNSVTQNVRVDAWGNFSATFDTSSLGVVDGPYTVTYAFAGNTGFTAATDTSTALTVTPAPLTVTADPNQSMTYGDTPNLTFTYTGLVDGDSSASFAGGLGGATSSSGVGSYAITLGDLAATGNYTIGTFNADTLTVTPATLTIEAYNNDKFYGSASNDHGEVDGVLNDDGITVTFSSAGDAATAQVGTGSYTITATLSDPLGALANYTVIQTDATLNVFAAPLTVTANVSRVYGAVDPAPQVSYSGFVNGEGPGVLGGTLSVVDADPATNTAVGTYTGAITASGLTADNYAISYVPGNLSVTPAPLTVTANSVSRVYGAAEAALQVSYSAFVNSEDPSVLGGTLAVVDADPATTTAVGSYTGAITASGLTSGNYTISYVAGDLSVTPAPLTVTANPVTRFFGALDPAFTATITGFVNSQTLATSDVTGNASFTSNDTISSPAGSYTITPGVGTLAATNYAFTTFDPGTLTVIPAGAAAYVLNNSNLSGAVTASGNANVSLSGGLYVDSSSSSAILASGNAKVAASPLEVVGGVGKSGNATVSTVSGSPLATNDPLSGLTAPSLTDSMGNPLPNYGAVSVAGNSTKSLSQGIYTSIKISGNASVTMTAGTYIILGGGFTVSGNASVTGSGGVTIFNAGSSYNGTTDGGNFGGITLSGNGNFNLSAPTSGTYAGIVIYQSRANTRALKIGGNATVNVQGIIYAKSAMLTLSGNGNLQDTLVVDTLNVSGNVALSQMASGSDGSGDAVGIANTLLAGDLNVYVNDPAGYFTSDMLARIQDTINAWDAVLAPYNVTITEVSDPTLANFVLDTSTTSAVGSAANGVLGCFNPANAELTILQGWNWYAGADSTQIGASQYDFQTTVSHELGHALGLGGSSSLTSPMNETLPAGTPPAMTVADLNIPEPSDGADPLSAAGFHFASTARALTQGVVTPALSSAAIAVPAGLASFPSPSGTATPSGQSPVASGEWPAASVPTHDQAGAGPSLVVGGADTADERALIPWVSSESTDIVPLVLDLPQQPAEPVATPARARTNRAVDSAVDELGSELIPRHWRNSAELFGVPVLPAGEGAGMEAAQDARQRDEAWILPVPANLTAPEELHRQPAPFTARLAAILLAVGYWGHGTGVGTSRKLRAGSPLAKKGRLKGRSEI